MRSILLSLLLLIVGIVMLGSEFGADNAAAQINKNGPADSARDKQLADLIRSKTNRTFDGLVEKVDKDGGVYVDLEGRFQNVMLAKIDGKGDPIAACITDIEEANNFFGRDLDTGRAIASIDFFKQDLEDTAKRHGMSVPEYEFYSRLASDFAEQRFAPATATFNIVNNDGAGEGFNETTAAFVVGEGGNSGTTRGQQRLNVFNAAAAVWAAFLDSSVAININSQFNTLTPCTTSGGVLGSAGAATGYRDFPGAQLPGTWHHVALANKQSGTDRNGTSAEINATFNIDIDSACLGAGTRFYYGLDNATPAQRINLFVVVLHEIGHGVGFSSFANGSTGALANGLPDVYTTHMYDRTTSKYWNAMTDAERAASALNTGNLLWDGPSVRLGSGSLTAGREASTGRVELFAPNPFQGGSSVSHFSTAASPNLLMEPSINAGLPLTLDLARQLMRDIGWYRDTDNDQTPDTIFNIAPATGGAVIGQTYPITWTNGDGFARNVTIELSTNGGTTYSAVATNIANTGSYSWTVPNSPTTQARIRVREADFAAPSGISASNFSIVMTPTAANASISGRVFDRYGRSAAGTFVRVAGPDNSAVAVRTNSFGYFTVRDLPTGTAYIVSVSGKTGVWQPRSISLTSDATGLEFRAQ